MTRTVRARLHRQVVWEAMAAMSPPAELLPEPEAMVAPAVPAAMAAQSLLPQAVRAQPMSPPKYLSMLYWAVTEAMAAMPAPDHLEYLVALVVPAAQPAMV